MAHKLTEKAIPREGYCLLRLLNPHIKLNVLIYWSLTILMVLPEHWRYKAGKIWPLRRVRWLLLYDSFMAIYTFSIKAYIWLYYSFLLVCLALNKTGMFRESRDVYFLFLIVSLASSSAWHVVGWVYPLSTHPSSHFFAKTTLFPVKHPLNMIWLALIRSFFQNNCSHQCSPWNSIVRALRGKVFPLGLLKIHMNGLLAAIIPRGCYWCLTQSSFTKKISTILPHPIALSSWLIGSRFKRQNPLPQCRINSVYSLFSRSPHGKRLLSSLQMRQHHCLAFFPCHIRFHHAPFPESVPSINHCHKNPCLRLYF